MPLRLAKKTPKGYAEHRDHVARKAREKSAAARDLRLDDLVPSNLIRRASSEATLSTWCLAYMAHHYATGLYPDQQVRMAQLQEAIQRGEDIAIATFRGGGKTTEFRDALLWATLNGHADPNHAVLVGATTADAVAHIEAIKTELETNILLAEDYPEAIAPIVALAGTSARANAQTAGGKRTRIRYEPKRIIFPTYATADVPHCRCSGAVIQVRTMDGSLRGLNVNGVRPGLVFLDDVETEESVRSLDQTAKLRDKLDRAIGGLGQHRGKLTRVMLCTVQTRGCLADEFTDPGRRPSWRGIRQRYMRTLPSDWLDHPRSGLWHRYIETRRDGLFGGPVAAREFYAQNRETMDAGADVSWPTGFRPEEYESAVEKFFALMADKAENGLAYCALELQNDPGMMDSDAGATLRPEDIAARCNGFKRRRIPDDNHVVSAFIDVHGEGSHLYYAILATGQEYRVPRLIDWGTWPETRTLGEQWPGLSQDAQIAAALESLTGTLEKHPWRKDSGTQMRLVGGVDSGSSWATTIFAFCRSHRSWVATKGNNPGFREFDRSGMKGALRGNNWRQLEGRENRLGVPVYLFNACYWKRVVRDRLSVDRREPEALTFAGDDAGALLPIARHLLAEDPKTIVEKSTGNEAEEWQQKPGWPNHWLDAVVGSFVVASIAGVTMAKHGTAQGRRHKRRQYEVAVAR